MISINRQESYGKVFNDVRCLSTDTKPVDNIKNGSTLVEMDTGRKYFFNAESKSWVEVSSGSGITISPANGVSF